MKQNFSKRIALLAAAAMCSNLMFHFPAGILSGMRILSVKADEQTEPSAHPFDYVGWNSFTSGAGELITTEQDGV